MVPAISIASFFVRLSILVLAFFSTVGASAAPLQKSWGVGIMSWPEKVQVTDGTGQSYDSNVQVYTPSLHFGARNYHARDGLLYEGYVFYGKADIQSDSVSLVYFQKRVPVYGAGVSYGWYYRPEGKQVNIGFTVPVQVRHADWTNPPGGGVNKKEVFAIGLMLDTRWRLTPDIAINQRVGTFTGNKGALWMMNLEWTL
jgi:hypothetical protein